MRAPIRPKPHGLTCAVPAFRDVPHGAYVHDGRLHLVATFAPYEGRPLPLWAREVFIKGRFTVEEVRLVVCLAMDGKGGYGRRMTVRPTRMMSDWLAWAITTPIEDHDERTNNTYGGEVSMLALGGFLPEMHSGREMGNMGTPECMAAEVGGTPGEAHALLRAASRKTIEAWFTEETLSVAGHLARGGNFPTGLLTDWHIPGPGSGNFAIAAKRWSCLVPMLLRQRRECLGTRPPAAPLRKDHPVIGSLDALLMPLLGPWAEPAHLRHLAGVRGRPSTHGARFIGGLPPEWISAAREDADGRQMVMVANALGKISEKSRLPSREMVRESKGRWRAYAQRPRQAAFPGVEETSVSAVARHVQDMCDHFQDSLLTPCIDRRIHYDGSTTSYRETQARNALTRSPESAARAIRCMLGAGGFSNLAERSARYTTLGDAIRLRLRETSPHLLSLQRWDPVLPEWSDAVTGLDLVPLSDQDELSAEGRRTPSNAPGAGLAHCVGGYGPRCVSGESRIVSVRRPLPEGFERVSTLQVSWTAGDKVPFEAQHHGRGNREPSSDAVEAVGRYLEAIAGCPPPPVVRVAMQSRLMAMAERCGYDHTRPGNIELALDLWRPMLPRTLRHLAPDGLTTHLLAIDLGTGTFQE